jgi:ankyrin repeat protein
MELFNAIENNDNDGWTALMLASRYGKIDILKLLLKR